MGLLDSLFGSAPRKSTSGPHVTRNRKTAERKLRMAETDAAVAKNSAAKPAAEEAGPLTGMARIMDAAKKKAAKEALKKKQKDTGSY